MDRGEIAIVPQGRAAAGASAGGEYDVAGEILIFGSQAIGKPGAHCRQAELCLATLHQ